MPSQDDFGPSSEERRCWEAIWELEGAFRACDRVASRSEPGKSFSRVLSRKATKAGDKWTWRRWKPYVIKVCVGLVILICALIGNKMMNDRMAPPPDVPIDQGTFDALWGARRSGE